MPNLLIIRGLPGSGKSTIAKKLQSNSNDCLLVTPNHKNIVYTNHYEADMFFENDGEYKFDKKYLSHAHDWCYNNVLKSLLDGNNTIVSNTFVKLWELNKYLDLEKFVPNTIIEVIEVYTSYDNIHKVPSEQLIKMKNNWEYFTEEMASKLPIYTIN